MLKSEKSETPDKAKNLSLHKAVDIIEAIEVVAVIETADVLRTGKSLLKTSESYTSCNSTLF